jgi:hypothetical protein
MYTKLPQQRTAASEWLVPTAPWHPGWLQAEIQLNCSTVTGSSQETALRFEILNTLQTTGQHILPEDGHRSGPKHVVVVHNKVLLFNINALQIHAVINRLYSF